MSPLPSDALISSNCLEFLKPHSNCSLAAGTDTDWVIPVNIPCLRLASAHSKCTAQCIYVKWVGTRPVLSEQLEILNVARRLVNQPLSQATTVFQSEIERCRPVRVLRCKMKPIASWVSSWSGAPNGAAKSGVEGGWSINPKLHVPVCFLWSYPGIFVSFRRCIQLASMQLRGWLHRPVQSASPAVRLWKVVGQHLFLNIIFSNVTAGTGCKFWCDGGMMIRGGTYSQP